eukprot:3368706-Prymnesium_polylepis.1
MNGKDTPWAIGPRALSQLLSSVSSSRSTNTTGQSARVATAHALGTSMRTWQPPGRELELSHTPDSVCGEPCAFAISGMP